MTDVTTFKELTGCELGTVSFVRDYVELDFDGAVLRSLAPPSVLKNNSLATFGEPGSRDALCKLIGLTVTSASDYPEALRLDFSGGEVFEIPKASEGIGPEIAHFVPEIDGRPDTSAMIIWENLIATR